MDSRPKLMIYGAGSAAKQFVCEYRDLGKYKDKYDFVGFIDDAVTGKICDFPVIGTAKEIQGLFNEGIDHILVSLMSDAVKRLDKILWLEEMGFKFPSLTGTKYIPKEIKLGKGVYIQDTAVLLGCDHEIGDYSVIGANSVIERAKIGKGTIISPNTFIGTGAVIGDAVRIYPFATISPRVTVGDGCIIYPYALVHKNMGDDSIKKKYDK
jgi:UDP-3-O-[3-hydroxymyristoyl] glucosamine N-acyltransferase